MFVHVSGSGMSVYVALIEHFHHVFCTFDHESGKIFNIYTSVFVTKLKVGTSTFLSKEVSDCLIVDFKIRYTDQELLGGITCDLCENILESSWHDTFLHWVLCYSSDGMSLSSTCLTIGKDCPIVTCDDIFAHWICCLSKNVGLLRATR